MCTMIVNRGTLQRNACLLSGSCWGRVKTMHDEFNKFITEAGPSTPVQISGIIVYKFLCELWRKIIFIKYILFYRLEVPSSIAGRHYIRSRE